MPIIKKYPAPAGLGAPSHPPVKSTPNILLEDSKNEYIINGRLIIKIINFLFIFDPFFIMIAKRRAVVFHCHYDYVKN